MYVYIYIYYYVYIYIYYLHTHMYIQTQDIYWLWHGSLLGGFYYYGIFNYQSRILLNGVFWGMCFTSLFFHSWEIGSSSPFELRVWRLKWQKDWDIPGKIGFLKIIKNHQFAGVKTLLGGELPTDRVGGRGSPQVGLRGLSLPTSQFFEWGERSPTTYAMNVGSSPPWTWNLPDKKRWVYLTSDARHLRNKSIPQAWNSGFYGFWRA